MTWALITTFKNWQHVYPLNDLQEHDIGEGVCSCKPEIDMDLRIVTHNAWDMREAQEFINNEDANGKQDRL